MSKKFKYYDKWETEILECSQCGWTGTFFQGSHKLYYEQIRMSDCPECGLNLAEVHIPTIDESEQNWSKLTVVEKKELIATKQFLEQQEAARLKTPDQLPEIDSREITIAWDFVEETTGRVTVLRFGDMEIWREPALYEGYQRFEEIVMILKQKYGERLADVAPTTASALYLYGDKLHAPDMVIRTRQALTQKGGCLPLP